MIRQLLYPDWCYVVRSDRRIVTVPPTTRIERWAHVLVWASCCAAISHVWLAIVRDFDEAVRVSSSGGAGPHE